MNELEILQKQVEALKELVEIQKQVIEALKARPVTQLNQIPYQAPPHVGQVFPNPFLIDTHVNPHSPIILTPEQIDELMKAGSVSITMNNSGTSTGLADVCSGIRTYDYRGVVS